MESERLFSLAEAKTLSLVGGKAYALGEMIRAGFNVPDGFVIPASLSDLTPEAKNLILNSFDKLQAKFVAVRSSALNEDNLKDTWAGQLDTFLNCAREELLKKVEECQKSANSTRAQSYAEQKGVHATQVAVIVQEMIESDLSGVAFSMHPISNDRKRVVIEAALGLGEAVVSGEITPDTYILKKSTGQIIEKTISSQARKLVRGEDGTTSWKNIGSEGNKQKLTSKQMEDLCHVVEELEAFFKYPVDVEWAVYKDIIYILQSRPITTLTQN